MHKRAKSNAEERRPVLRNRIRQKKWIDLCVFENYFVHRIDGIC